MCIRDSVVISAAAGSVGSIAGQLCKAMGATVIGFAGGGAKCAHVIDTLGFDVAVDYKAEGFADKFAEALGGKRVNVFWDNTSGPIAAAVYPMMADHGRVVLCGEISAYNSTTANEEALSHAQVNHLILERRLRVEGILVTEFFPRIGEALPTLIQLHSEGKLAGTAHVVNGFENTVTAFLGLFEGKNTGKTIVAI
eukprot:TRINITY_DN52363_c0_g1_i2.p1 TRINITY_DN52363_c0_g1~~TRINITY_DN52363_c0_g1_i2.p1  ORF type:complete len:196 (-),score=29.69 TRINITY_DN52363_c0_g1_i2:187-774(-)